MGCYCITKLPRSLPKTADHLQTKVKAKKREMPSHPPLTWPPQLLVLDHMAPSLPDRSQCRSH